MKTSVLMSVSLLLVSMAMAQQEVIHPTGIFRCVYHDTSPPLRDMRMIQPAEVTAAETKREIPNQNFMAYFEDENAAGLNREADPVVQSEFGDDPALNTIVNFDGLANVNLYSPPDPVLDVGPDHVFQVVNVSFAIYSKTGSLLYGPAALYSIWSGFVGYTGDGDPIILYDHLADRWLISQFALPSYPNGPFYELVAVSQTSDPLGAWHRYKFEFTDMPDYPKLGVWPDGYYLSVNRYASGTLNWMGSAVAVLERDSMLAGQEARMIYFNPGLGTKPMTPADLDGPAPPAGTPGCFALVKESPAGSGGDQINLFELHADWTNIMNSTLTGPQVISVAPFDQNMCGGSRNCIPQPGVSTKIDPLTGFLMHRMQYRYFNTHQALLINHTVDVDATDHAGVRWYELRNDGSGWTIYQQSSYAPDADNRWVASIAMDGQQNIAMGFSVSGPTTYPSIRATGRRVTDPPGTITFLEEPIKAGSGSQTMGEGRWGDYSSLSVDPQDDATFWYTNMYFLNTSYDQWKTRIASFTINTLPIGIPGQKKDEETTHLLAGNYPNPFSGSTVITYFIRSGASVTMKVFDLLGKEISVLVDDYEEPGEKSVIFDAGNLPEGMYFCQLKVGNAIETKKMAIAR